MILSLSSAGCNSVFDFQELSVVLLKEESNIYFEVADEMKDAQVKYEAVKNEIETIKQNGGTVPKEKKKEKYAQVNMA